MTYQVYYGDDVVRKHIPKLPKNYALLIKKAIEERLIYDPLKFGKPLRYSLQGYRRLRVGDYRIIYRIEIQNSSVIIIAIMYRKDIYDQNY